MREEAKIPIPPENTAVTTKHKNKSPRSIKSMLQYTNVRSSIGKLDTTKTRS